MVAVSKKDYKRIRATGFNPKFKPYRSSHGRKYYMVDSDYNNYVKYWEKKLYA